MDGTNAVAGAALVAVLTGGCAAAPEATTHGADIVPGPGGQSLIERHYEDFDDVVDNHPVVVIARATDNAWQEPPPGTDPAANEAHEASLPRDGTPVLDSGYQWREFEILEVLHGDYDGATLHQGGFVDHTEAGKIYVLFGAVTRTSAEAGPWRSKEYITEGIPPYVVQDGGLLQSTDPAVQSKLRSTLPLAELRPLIP